MANLNKVMLIGNLTRDPELRYLPNNTPVVGIGMAVNRRWKSKDGDEQEETLFVDLESFGKQAEVVNQYLKKGDPLYAEGRLKLDQWEDKEGNKRSKMKVILEKFEFLKSSEGKTSNAGQSTSKPSEKFNETLGVGKSQPLDEEDIPF